MSILPPELLTNLAGGAQAADECPDCPTESWRSLMNAGACRWSIPPQFGGDALPHSDQLQGSELIASACVTTAFILSQREAAIRHLLRGPAHWKDRYLTKLARGEAFVTIGLSQITTSRQH